jgi:hypothetical protein
VREGGVTGRVKILEVDAELLRDLLSLPETTKIESVASEFDIHTYGTRVYIRISDPSFPDLVDGSRVPHTSATAKAHRTPSEFVGYT